MTNFHLWLEDPFRNKIQHFQQVIILSSVGEQYTQPLADADLHIQLVLTIQRTDAENLASGANCNLVRVC